jgi:hypothetical protein
LALCVVWFELMIVIVVDCYCLVHFSFFSSLLFF